MCTASNLKIGLVISNPLQSNFRPEGIKQKRIQFNMQILCLRISYIHHHHDAAKPNIAPRPPSIITSTLLSFSILWCPVSAVHPLLQHFPSFLLVTRQLSSYRIFYPESSLVFFCSPFYVGDEPT